MRSILAISFAFALYAAFSQSAQSAPYSVSSDAPYPGVLTVAVDATDLDRRIFQVKQTIPVKAGRMTLLYPRWLPGNHGPNGDVGHVSGLQFRGGGKSIAWTRDPLNPFAFGLEIPTGVQQIEAEFQVATPLKSDGPGRVVVTPSLVNIQWITALFYPAGFDLSRIQIAAKLRVPDGWQIATALRPENTSDLALGPVKGWVDYRATSIATLADSPVFAGKHVKRFALDDAGSKQPVVLNLLTDEADQLKATDEQIAAHKRLVQQADRLFGGRPFRHYDFLFSLSDQLGGIGLEHHESSENGVEPDYFKDWKSMIGERELLAHEYAHAWNGKYRRPADLTTRNFDEPMQNSLLWVYEGMTQYWGMVLTARSGLATPEQSVQEWADTAASLNTRSGKAWRNLQDTTNEATIHSRGRGDWRDWQRGGDYYAESALIWLEADALIRELSASKKSLDDFARLFFAVPLDASTSNAAPTARTYVFADVVAALNTIQPYDWTSFLRKRLDSNEAGAPLGGLIRSGYRLDYVAEQPESSKAADSKWKSANFVYSLGLSLKKDGSIRGVMWNSLAFKAGLATNVKIIAVNGTAYDADRLNAALVANKDGKAPIELLVQRGDQYKTIKFDYRDGPRYPKLVKTGQAAAEDYLLKILAPVN